LTQATRSKRKRLIISVYKNNNEKLAEACDLLLYRAFRFILATPEKQKDELLI
jgi:hypothetical protein